MVKWTPEQISAINDRGSNLLVTAAAGSGKTAVLVQRVINIIVEDGIDIDKLLIVTFTRAAAAEMKERIRRAILKKLEETQGRDARLLRQINLLNKAQISTLHSFCQSVVKDHFHLADVDPGFKVGEETEMLLLKDEAAEETLEQEYEKGQELFYELLEMFSAGKNDHSLQELIISLYDFIQSKPEPYQWLQKKVEELAMTPDEFDDSPLAEQLSRQSAIQLEGAMEITEQAIRIAQLPNGPAHYLPMLEADRENLQSLQSALQPSSSRFITRIQGIEFMALSRARNDCDVNLRETVKERREEVKKIINNMKANFMGKGAEALIADLNRLHQPMEYLQQMVGSFHDHYRQLKAEKGVLDFNDLEHYALQVLQQEKVAAEYRQRFAYVFVDEYQDSNQVQEAIISQVKNEDNLFMVGDVKQSIYRFRLADPTLFMEKYNSFADQEGEMDRRIFLRKNFRSRKTILDAVNFIFTHIMSETLGEIHYDEDAALKPRDEELGPELEQVELIILNQHYETREDGADLPDELAELNKIQREALTVAGKIKALLQTEIYDPQLETTRSVTYKDIVILLRTTRSWIEVFTDVFNEAGIPSYADINSGYLDAVEISMFLNLLRIIDNPRQDIELISVLRSPIFRFSLEELAAIRLGSMERTYYGALRNYEAKDDLQDKIKTFLERLHEWQKMSRYLPLEELIQALMIDSGYLYYVTAMPGGMQRVANIRLLFSRARNYSASTMHGLFNFLHYIQQVRDSQTEIGTAKTLGENDDVVRLMSVHKSKGLEFPIVILAGLGKQFNMTDTNQDVLLHKDLGIGPRMVDTRLRTISSTVVRNVIKEKIRLENLSEEMRVLYVACTRAQEKLILTGAVKNLSNQVNKWSKSVTAYNLSQAKCGLDWFAPVLMRHADGAPIRELSSIAWEAADLWGDQSCWEVNIRNLNQLTLNISKSRQDRLTLWQQLLDHRPDEDSPWRETVHERLNWIYPYKSAGQIPAKLSVTQIQKLQELKLTNAELNIPVLINRPQFKETSKKISALDRGNIMHFILQHLDLRQVNSEEEIRDQLEAMVAQQLLAPEEIEAVDTGRLLSFWQGELGQRVLQSKAVKRETPFNFLVKAGEVMAGAADTDEELMVQGIIDLFFLEGEEIVLVDYKTDYITSENRAERIESYRIQVELYRRALESILQRRVKESYLYFLGINEAVMI